MNLLFFKESLKKCITVSTKIFSSITVFKTDKKQISILISEGSCDTENCSFKKSFQKKIKGKIQLTPNVSVV